MEFEDSDQALSELVGERVRFNRECAISAGLIQPLTEDEMLAEIAAVLEFAPK